MFRLKYFLIMELSVREVIRTVLIQIDEDVFPV